MIPAAGLVQSARQCKLWAVRVLVWAAVDLLWPPVLALRKLSHQGCGCRYIQPPSLAHRSDAGSLFRASDAFGRACNTFDALRPKLLRLLIRAINLRGLPSTRAADQDTMQARVVGVACARTGRAVAAGLTGAAAEVTAQRAGAVRASVRIKAFLAAAGGPGCVGDGVTALGAPR
eukprot:COSAG06_NODE_10929_length_1594_cov_3.125753_1_plen_175_part_00